MFKKYRITNVAEMRPYVVGEDLTGISVSKEDSPKQGDMIARNPNNHNDQWLVAKEYFMERYEDRIRIQKGIIANHVENERKHNRYCSYCVVKMRKRMMDCPICGKFPYWTCPKCGSMFDKEGDEL